MISICVYRSAMAPVPIARDTFDAWDAFADELEAMVREYPDCAEDAPREVQKENMLAWSPHTLADACACEKQFMCKGGPHRLLRNVQQVTALVLDVDAVPGNADGLDVLIAMSEQASKRGLVYESPSSTPEAPRVRVVVPVSRPLFPDECRPSRVAFAHALGLDVQASGVLGAIDAAKLFFAGRMHGSPERRVWRW